MSSLRMPSPGRVLVLGAVLWAAMAVAAPCPCDDGEFCSYDTVDGSGDCTSCRPTIREINGFVGPVAMATGKGECPKSQKTPDASAIETRTE